MKSGAFALLTPIALCMACASLPSRADDWPQWRGPQRNGISEEKDLLKEWPKEGPKVAWKVTDLGSGYFSPAVVGGALYVLSNDGLDNESVQARGTSDGHQLWAARIGKVGNPDQQPSYPAARSTPSVDGEVLYALGSDGDLVCLETASGKERWRKNLRKDFSGEPGIWAYAESPLIDGDTLVCTPGGREATMIALDKKTGAPIWKAALPGGDQAAYSSPIVIEAAGIRQYVQFLQKGLAGLDAKTGKLLWHYAQTAQGSPANIPSPVAAGDWIYSASGRGGGGLVHLKAEQGTVTADPVYSALKLPNSIGGSIVTAGNLYGTGQTLMCVDFQTGKVKWQNRCIGAASLCLAEGLLYLHGENGELALVEATPTGYQEKSRFTPSDQPERGSAKAWAYPVVANGHLYIRDGGVLWCYDIHSEPAKVAAIRP